MKQCVGTRPYGITSWHLTAHVLCEDPSKPVRRQAGHVISTVAHAVAENYAELMKAVGRVVTPWLHVVTRGCTWLRVVTTSGGKKGCYLSTVDDCQAWPQLLPFLSQTVGVELGRGVSAASAALEPIHVLCTPGIAGYAAEVRERMLIR